jgi:hypothetical protein
VANAGPDALSVDESILPQTAEKGDKEHLGPLRVIPLQKEESPAQLGKRNALIPPLGLLFL